MSALSPADAGRVLMVGCGTMGGAMLRRWLHAGMAPEQVTVFSPSGRRIDGGVRVVTALQPGPLPDTVVLAMKPQQLNGAAEILATMEGEAGLLLSVLAGVEAETLVERFAARTIVRAMPNLPVAIGQGVVALHAVAADERDMARAEALVAPLGRSEWIADEGLFDVVTALAGSGPAFLFRFVDALGAAGAALGLPEDQARRLALATVEGAAIMAAASEDEPATLADRVASKGGSTREGLDVLDRNGALVRLLTETLTAATRRNRDLAAVARA